MIRRTFELSSQFSNFMSGLGTQDIYSLVAALKTCSRTKDLQTGMRLHAQAIKHGYHVNRFMANTLVDMYSKCGRMPEARQVFDTMNRHCVISWTALILGYVQSGESELALNLFSRMQHDKVAPDGRTFYAVLGACIDIVSSDAEKRLVDGVPAKEWCLEKGKGFHKELVRLGLESDTFVASSLVVLYATCGDLPDAKRIFDRIKHKNSLSWNSIIDGYSSNDQPELSLRLYCCMQLEGVRPDSRTFIAVLKACASVSAKREDMRTWCLKRGDGLHSQIKESIHHGDSFVTNTLVDFYGKCGGLVTARAIFDKLVEPCNASWNAVIMGYAQSGDSEEALELFSRMTARGLIPDARTYVSALKACTNLVAGVRDQAGKERRIHGKAVEQWCLDKGREIHSQVVKSPHTSNVYVRNILVDLYAKCGSMEEAGEVFQGIPRPTVMSWNAILMGYAMNGQGEYALELFERMQREQGLVPDARTYVAALKACSGYSGNGGGEEDSQRLLACGRLVKPRCIESGARIHSEIIRRGYDKDVFVASTLVDMYATCGNMSEARKVFDNMDCRNSVLWNTMILGYANSTVEVDGPATAVTLFACMQLEEGVAADNVTLVGVLKACARLGQLGIGRDVHAEAVHIGLHRDILVAASLIDFYGKCGSMSEAENVFASVTNRNAVVWNALIGGYTHQADAHRVFEVFEMMKRESLAPTDITFLSILNCCTHAGLVEKGKEFFESMSRVYGFKPSVEHYTCLVDLLARSNRLDEAVETVKTMPFTASQEMWLSILSACRKWGNVEVGKLAFDNILALKVDSSDSAAYVLMNNIYAGENI